nr:GAF and ANTAR domain-containing protein [Mycobacterium sp. Z3061]
MVGALSIDELIAKLADFTRHAVPGADGAGVAVINANAKSARIQANAVTAAFVQSIHALQYEVHHEGPTIASMQTRRPAVSGSLSTDDRWPRFGGAVARQGVHSALALPLMVHDQVIGIIDTYAFSYDAFADHAVELGARFAATAAVSLFNAQLLTDAGQRAEHLQRAMVSRSVIDQAIGIVRGQSGDSAEDAFGRLVRISQSTNTKLNIIAAQVVTESVRRGRVRHELDRLPPSGD